MTYSGDPQYQASYDADYEENTRHKRRKSARSATAAATKLRLAINPMASPIASECSALDARERDGNDNRLSEEARHYLDRVRGRGWLDAIRVAFDRADQLKVLFVGETIIDEYRYVHALAKPSKEFILATVEAREPELFLGGVVAASLHAEWRSIEVITDNRGLKKTRFIDADFGKKLFEVYDRSQLVLTDFQRERVLNKIRTANADVVVIFDFGHGLIDNLARTALNSDRWFSAANAQTNAANYGFNPVTKYHWANLICVDLPEARLATGQQHGSEKFVHGALAGQGSNKHVIVTHGRNGCYCPQHIPAFGSRAIDTMGAGDAFLAVTAPLVAAGLDLEAAAFVGNVAGAIKTDIVGHRRHVGRAELMQAVESLLK